MHIERVALDGVPTVVAQSASAEASAALMFRVGRADEPLAQSGITHLVEHLAMHALGKTPYESNAFVDDTRTLFWASGTEVEVAGFLTQITESLRALSLERLELERELLKAESAQRGHSTSEDVFRITRYGAGPYGLPSMSEFGLRRVTAADVSAWQQQFFRSENAVLCLEGVSPTSGLVRLETGGTRHRVPLPDPPYTPLPGWEKANVSGVGVSMQASRSSAFSAAMGMLNERLEQRLRHETALCYSVESSRVLMGDLQHVVLWLSSVPGRGSDALAETLATLDQIYSGGFGDAELERWRTLMARAEESMTSAMPWLDVLGYQELIGLPTDVATLNRERDEVTTSSAAEALRAGLDSLFALVPGDVDVHDTRFQRSPQFSTDRLEGQGLKMYKPVPPYESLDHRLEASPEGLTLLFSRTQWATVRFASATVRAWQSGHRELIGRDAFRISLDPVEWKDGERLLALIDGGVAPEQVVPMDAISRPRPVRQFSFGTKVAVVITLWLFAVCTSVALVYAALNDYEETVATPSSTSSDQLPADVGGLIALVLISGAIAAVLTMDLRRDAKNRRFRKRVTPPS